MGALLARYADLDVRRNVNRRVPGCVVVLFDFGPQPPKVIGVPAQADAKRMRKYEVERAAWVKETGGKPVDVGLNSIDATEVLRDGSRWRTSATAPEPVQVQPRDITAGQPISLNPWGDLINCWWVGDNFSDAVFIMPTVDAAALINLGRGQFSRIK
jgi:hypothetical protein